MNAIRFTPDERLAPPSDKIDAAARMVREDGYVVLEDVVDPDHVAVLRDKMLADLPTILARPDTPFNFNAINVQQDPPPFPPYLFRDVWCNEVAIALSEAVLGTGVKSAFYSGNTALPGGQRQPVHPDVAQLWPDLTVATPAFGLVVNLPTVDMDPENGATELWPGTHTDTSVWIGEGAARIPEERLAAWRARRPPFQPTVRAGSLVVRDIRLWHAGMPNRTERPRPMIAMIHWVGWWDVEPVPFHASAREILEHPRLRTVARYVDGPIDYLMHSEAYDYTPGEATPDA